MGYIEELRAKIGHIPLILNGSVAVILNNQNEILLQKRVSPYGTWGLPGGLMEMGETAEETAKREVFEETGLRINNLKLIDILSGAEYFVKCSNGDEFYSVTIGYFTKDFEGDIVDDKDEVLEHKFFNSKNLPQEMLKSHRKIIEKFNEKYF
mgnify:CR=1 FL=1